MVLHCDFVCQVDDYVVLGVIRGFALLWCLPGWFALCSECEIGCVMMFICRRGYLV